MIEEASINTDSVRFAKGSPYVMRKPEKKKFRIVGDLESDVEQNLVSISSPMARALLGKKEDDLVEIRAPKGIIEYAIVDIHS